VSRNQAIALLGPRQLGLLTPEGHDQHIAIRRTGGIDRLDGRHAMKHSPIVQKCGIERLTQREGAEWASVQRVDRRRAAGDIATLDQQDQHEVHAVAMHALGRRITLLV
jgi:hypothetical protein